MLAGRRGGGGGPCLGGDTQAIAFGALSSLLLPLAVAFSHRCPQDRPYYCLIWQSGSPGCQGWGLCGAVLENMRAQRQGTLKLDGVCERKLHSGVIWTEMVTFQPLFQDQALISLVTEQFRLVGSPTAAALDFFSKLAGWSGQLPTQFRKGTLEHQFSSWPSESFEILTRFLTLLPSARITSVDAFTAVSDLILSLELTELLDAAQLAEQVVQRCKLAFSQFPLKISYGFPRCPSIQNSEIDYRGFLGARAVSAKPSQMVQVETNFW